MNKPVTFHARGGEYTFDEMEAEAEKRREAAAAKAKAAEDVKKKAADDAKKTPDPKPAPAPQAAVQDPTSPAKN